MDVFFDRSNRAGGDEQQTVGGIVRRCDRCRESDMVLRRKPDGNFMVGCLGFPQCRNVIWLPGSLSEASVTSTVCITCTPGPVFMIQFKFRRMEIPMNYNVEHLGCIGGCDDILRQLIETCGTGSRNLISVSGRGRGSSTSSCGAQRSVPRQSACTHCRQTGHSSNNCPLEASRSRITRSQGTNQQQGEPSIPCNSCGRPCTLRTANTETNRGKKFYSCQLQGCNFFVWEDNHNGRNASTSNYSSRASNLSRRGGRSRGGRSGANATQGTFVSATGEPISDRRCFICEDPSHFAKVCPRRGM